MEAIYELIQRVLPNHAKQITCEYIQPDAGRDLFEISGEKGRIVLRGNNSVSIALALGQYLKYTAHVNLSWCGSDWSLPEELPAPNAERRVIEQKYRVYMNYCTFNYSASWWDFERWEKEIDFMALNGINMPLCAVGIEGIWYYTLTEFGFTDEEARSFIAGPAFLAWQHMGNLEGFGGSVSRAWIDKRIELGKRIINRVTELGMFPIQQGFSGCVPKLLGEKYPESKIAYKMPWFGMKSTAQLDPTDPLFIKLGKKFLEVQKRLFGAYGYYASDPFHESKPPIEGEAYMRRVGETISKLFADFDENYTWVMQAWSIRKEIVCAIPKEKLLILDLNGERHTLNETFWGYNFVLGNLHNFGGRTKLHGDLKLLAENAFVKVREHGGNVVGTGLFMEGIGQNPVYYDLAFDMLTKRDTVDLKDWIAKYSFRRYKTNNVKAQKAWDILLETVYAEGTNGVETSSVICARPAIHVKKSGPNLGFKITYDIKKLQEAAKCLLSIESETDGYAYDLVDITRQYLSDYAYGLYQKVAESFRNKDKERFAILSKRFIGLLQDVDCLLAHREEFSLKKWICDAENCAAIQEEKPLFSYNAAALVTIWGEDEESRIFDYSWREWAGLIGQYYEKRWTFFFDRMQRYLEEGIEYTEEGLPQAHGRESWRANEMYSEMADMEIRWIRGDKTFTEREPENLKDLVLRLLEKYKTE